MVGLSRGQASIIMQLQASHVPLGKHLFHINKADTVTCPSCQQNKESVHHYLFDCPMWQHEQWHMGQSLGRKAKSVDCVLNTPKGIKEVIRFVDCMGRFTSTFGEILPPGND